MGCCCINGIFIDSISTSSVSQKVKNDKDRDTGHVTAEFQNGEAESRAVK